MVRNDVNILNIRRNTQTMNGIDLSPLTHSSLYADCSDRIGSVDSRSSGGTYPSISADSRNVLIALNEQGLVGLVSSRVYLLLTDREETRGGLIRT